MVARLPSYDDVCAAAERIRGPAVRTPLLNYPEADEALGARVYFKPEVLQRTGSFKFRGAYNRLVQLDSEARRAGVVAFSSGNHAQGVAEAGRLLGVHATIVMPSDAPAAKIEGTRARGAEVVLYDRYSEDREAIARKLSAERGAILVPSYDDPDIIAGQGTAGLEIAQDAKQLDYFLAPLSGGGLMAGCALALKALHPNVKIFGVEPAGFDDHRRSLEAGRRIANASGARSICDALQAAMPGELTFEINRVLLEGVLVVTDDEVRSAQEYARRTLKLTVEPGGAVALAAVLTQKLNVRRVSVAIMLSGGNT